MTWRVHLANMAIQQLQIISGKQAVLAAWPRPNRVHFYDLETGILLSEMALPSPPDAPYSSEAWHTYTAQLNGPDEGMYLPVVRTRQLEIFFTDDGKLRLYHGGDAQLVMEVDGQTINLDTGDAQRFRALDMDRALGTVAALDEQGRLYLYQQTIRIGAFDIGLKPQTDTRLSIVLARGSDQVVATDGQRLVLCDTGGEVQQSLDLHYNVGRLAVSPGGGMIIASDIEAGVIRAYNSSLMQTHQRFAIDLVASATQVQLLADLPPVGTTISALVAHNKGIFAFAMSGVVCVSNVEHMDKLPRARALF